MSATLDLFLDQPVAPWPALPGRQRRDDGNRLRGAVLRALGELGEATPDELAGRLGLSVLAIRPRVSELRRLGKVVRTGERRANASGLKAWVLRRVAA